jgi:hypothetical protein
MKKIVCALILMPFVSLLAMQNGFQSSEHAECVKKESMNKPHDLIEVTA